jgi:hypothetical protein
MREVTTDAEGRYTIGNIVAATYDVQISAAGFRQVTMTGVTATLNTVTRLDVQMELGSRTQEATVSGSAAQLQTYKSDVHTERNPHEMANMPLPNYRNLQSLINLVPGATPAQFTNSITDTPRRSLSTIVNGTNRNNNNTRIDGAADVFVWLPHVTAYLPLEETIETINVATSSFDAEQGMAGGAATTLTTKSGTNAFHGVAFAYWDDNHLQARNYFYYGQGTPFSLHNIDGGTLGGPIIKDKLFFFGSWEGTRERTNFSMLSTVPTADERNGDFSAYETPIYDPLTGDSTDTGYKPDSHRRRGQVNGTFSAYSGLPFTVTVSGAPLNAPNNIQTADQVLPTVAKFDGIGTGNPYYDPNAFAPVTAVVITSAAQDQRQFRLALKMIF